MTSADQMCSSLNQLMQQLSETQKGELMDWLLMTGTAFPRGGTPYNGLYGEAPPKRGTFFRLQVYKRVGISRAEVYEKTSFQ